MLIYLVCFLLTCLCCIIVQRYEKNKVIKWIFIVLAVLIPSIVGGVRDETIGTDIEVYGKNYFVWSAEFSNFITYANRIGTSFGYLFINFLVTRFTTNINVLFFVSQLMINGLVFSTIYRYRNKCSIVIAMLYYLCVYYCRTFNFLKQSFALAIIFFGIRYIEDRKLIKYSICVFVASLFHSSAMVAILLYFANRILKTKYKVVFTYCLIGGTCFFVMFSNTMLEVLYNLNILGERYYDYLDRWMRPDGEFFLIDTIFRIIFVGLYLLRAKKINKDNKINELLGLSIILDLILFQLRNTIQYADRIAFYFGYMNILLVPQIQKHIINDTKGKLLFNFCVVGFLLFFWYYKFVVGLSCEVYPYSSAILGI